MDTPFYDLVNKDLSANLRQRSEFLRMCANDPSAQHDLFMMCSRDMLFWLNMFGWTFDPRLQPDPVVPFITWEFQDETLSEINDAIDVGQDRLIEKSRDMGASWMILVVYTFRWLFRAYQSFLLVSRKEDLVDKTGDSKSLFWKIDFLLDRRRMPGWLLPPPHQVERNKLHLGNIANGSTIDGESTTGDVARGDRRTGIMLDEFASVEEGEKVLRATRDATDARAFNSTPKGQGNAFYEVKEKMKPQGRVITLHWKRHPNKARGLYIDTNSPFKGQGCNNGERSLWYDEQCMRAAHPMEIAQELDINYHGSDYVFFDLGELRRIREAHCMEPPHVGEYEYDFDTLEAMGFVEQHRGKMAFWMPIGGQGFIPPAAEYVIGCDISAGAGSSNTVFSIGNRNTGEKVGRFKSSVVRPEEAAKIAVSLSRWFHNALLIWEANGGPGRNFGDVVVESGYRFIWWRQNEQSISRKTSDIPGWYSTKENKVGLLGEYRRALKHDLFINRSTEGINEAQAYVFTQAGSVEHTRSLQSEDPSGAKDNHGDEVIADALCWKGMRSSGIVQEPQIDTPTGSFLYRRELREEAHRVAISEPEW